MKGATKIALVAAIGNMLQGWDNGAIAGGLLYIKPEFHLEDKPTVEGIVVASTLIGAVCSTLGAGPGADWLGRRMMLCISGLLYCISACLMLWSPTVTLLIISRFLVGLAIGLVVTIVPIFIAETAPSEIRGQLATFPQLLGSTGLLVVYAMVFGLSLTANPSWRFMLGVLLLPSMAYLALAIFYLPESPRWLVSKGRMVDAKHVLQRLRDKDDVSAELALLVEGLGIGGETSLEEWVLRPAAAEETVIEHEPAKDESHIKLFGPEEGIAWIATPIPEETVVGTGLVSRGSSMLNAVKSSSLLDPVVSIIGSLQAHHDYYPQPVSEVPDTAEPEAIDKEEEDKLPEEGYVSDEEAAMVGKFDEDTNQLRSPLLRQRKSSGIGHVESQDSGEHRLVTRGSSLLNGVHGESLGGVGIGGGWQLAWQWTGPEGTEGNPEEGTFKRVFLLQEAPENVAARSTASLPGIDEDAIPAAALISQPAQYILKDIEETPVGPAMVHPAQTAVSGPAWSDLLVGGVKRALVVGMTLQLLQQFSGINAVLYFIPQILQQSGADALLADMGISSASASILGSAVTSLLMMPCIIMAMRLMDRAGRRQLLLRTLPVLLLGLLAVTISNIFLKAGLVQALVSFASVTLYACSFVMGFGPIPNILCSEIFPTKVRGLCIGICAATFWICNIIVTYLFPVLLVQLGLGGVFSLFAVVCLVAWVFIFLKVPETKGMPLEVISDFFAMTHLDMKKGALG